jgi:transposase-like protein
VTASGEREVIVLGKKAKRYSPRFQFQVVLEALRGDRDAVEIARGMSIDIAWSMR